MSAADATGRESERARPAAEAEPQPGSPSREPQELRIEPVLSRGNGVARPSGGSGVSVLVPFSLPGERIEAVPPSNGDEWKILAIPEPSIERVEPGCPHFGVCGGCQLQMASAPAQLQIKLDVLEDTLLRAGVTGLPSVQTHAAEPWAYRNRIRLRVGRAEGGQLRLGYNRRGSRDFLPIRTCPISAPLLWRAAESLLAASVESLELSKWLGAAAEVEIAADDRLAGVQLLFLLEGKPPSGQPEQSFARAMQVLAAHLPELAAPGSGAGAVLLGPQLRLHERTRTALARWGAAGLTYRVARVAEESYWIARGGFFQVNRFLLPRLVELVCGDRSGALAWDLFAGVGLFSRVLARHFRAVTAVEGNPASAPALHGSLLKLGTQHRAVQASTLEFLRTAVVQRERPELIVLDPPRAGAGEEACELLLRLAARELVYVSCDPLTLARDLAVLQRGYRVQALHLVDLFPQTYHQEAVVVLERRL